MVKPSHRWAGERSQIRHITLTSYIRKALYKNPELDALKSPPRIHSWYRTSSGDVLMYYRLNPARPGSPRFKIGYGKQT